MPKDTIILWPWASSIHLRHSQFTLFFSSHLLLVVQVAIIWLPPYHFSYRKCMSCEWRSRGCRKSVKRWHMKWTWTWIRGCHSGRQTRSFTKISTLDSRVSFFPHRRDLLHPVSYVNCALLTVVSHSDIFRIYRWTTVSADSVSVVSVIRGWPRPPRKIWKIKRNK